MQKSLFTNNELVMQNVSFLSRSEKSSGTAVCAYVTKELGVNFYQPLHLNLQEKMEEDTRMLLLEKRRQAEHMKKMAFFGVTIRYFLIF